MPLSISSFSPGTSPPPAGLHLHQHLLCWLNVEHSTNIWSPYLSFHINSHLSICSFLKMYSRETEARCLTFPQKHPGHVYAFSFQARYRSVSSAASFSPSFTCLAVRSAPSERVWVVSADASSAKFKWGRSLSVLRRDGVSFQGLIHCIIYGGCCWNGLDAGRVLHQPHASFSLLLPFLSWAAEDEQLFSSSSPLWLLFSSLAHDWCLTSIFVI